MPKLLRKLGAIDDEMTVYALLSSKKPLVKKLIAKKHEKRQKELGMKTRRSNCRPLTGI